jgi:Domain of unknown function (DUF1839)
MPISGLDPSTYSPHALHSPERLFPETNCYTDVWVELLHAQGFEPMAMLAYCLVVDFEGDQWTFIKPPPEDLARLYGLEVQEFVLYRSLPEHVEEQLAQGRSVIVEVDAFYLPDTAGRSYREYHEKSSIAIESFDLDTERLRYFHGPGFFELAGVDFRNVLRIGREFSVDVLPPYAELVRGDRLPPCPDGDLRAVAMDLLSTQLARVPTSNPVSRFSAHLSEDLPRLMREGHDAYHAYAFVTVRQCGAAWEAAASFLDWLGDGVDPALQSSATAFSELAASAKTVLFKLARAVAKGRPVDPGEALAAIEDGWEDAMSSLHAVHT